MMLFVADIVLFAAGYVASVYTWQWVRTKWFGAQTEIEKLEARITALKDVITGK